MDLETIRTKLVQCPGVFMLKFRTKTDLSEPSSVARSVLQSTSPHFRFLNLHTFVRRFVQRNNFKTLGTQFFNECFSHFSYWSFTYLRSFYRNSFIHYFWSFIYNFNELLYSFPDRREMFSDVLSVSLWSFHSIYSFS